jgi:hypothetical protein
MRFGWAKRPAGGGTTVVRTLAILAAVGLCLAGAAYATTRRAAPVDDGARVPLQPRLLTHPEAVTAEAVAEFDFAQPARPAGKVRPGDPLVYECRLDDGAWKVCEGPLTLAGIGRGPHRFAARAVNHAGTAGPAASFEWRRTRAPKPEPSAPAPSPAAVVPAAESATKPPVEPPVQPPIEPPVEPPVTGLPFTIEQVGTLGDLFPGAPAQTIAVRVENPNPVAISVVSLTAVIAADPPGCPAAENFVLTPADTSSATPLLVAAESTATLASAGIPGPGIAMLKQPWSQDACQAAELQIVLSGEATG